MRLTPNQVCSENSSGCFAAPIERGQLRTQEQPRIRLRESHVFKFVRPRENQSCDATHRTRVRKMRIDRCLVSPQETLFGVSWSPIWAVTLQLSFARLSASSQSPVQGRDPSVRIPGGLPMSSPSGRFAIPAFRKGAFSPLNRGKSLSKRSAAGMELADAHTGEI
jgi:hypothetical protein